MCGTEGGSALMILQTLCALSTSSSGVIVSPPILTKIQVGAAGGAVPSIRLRPHPAHLAE